MPSRRLGNDAGTGQPDYAVWFTQWSSHGGCVAGVPV